jgi:hypothetical protein
MIGAARWSLAIVANVARVLANEMATPTHRSGRSSRARPARMQVYSLGSERSSDRGDAPD